MNPSPLRKRFATLGENEASALFQKAKLSPEETEAARDGLAPTPPGTKRTAKRMKTSPQAVRRLRATAYAKLRSAS